MDELIQVRDLSGGYGKTIVINDISFTIRRGEFVGIIGPNGSGKSTLLRLMTQVISAQRGQVLLKGRDIRKIGSKEFSRQVAFVAQEEPIDFPFTVGEIVLMGRIPHLRRLQSENAGDFRVAEEALTATDALRLKDKDIDRLSAGERQRVVIAKALAQEPILLFLDEPTSYLDIGHQILILDLLKKLNKDKALTVVIVMHDLNLASEYCDRLIMLDEGRIFREGVPEEVLTYQNIETVYKTVVVVKKNPVSSKPYVILISGKQLCRQD